MPDWGQMMRNPYGIALKKYMHGILGERYGKHSSFLDRISATFMVQEDMHNFGKLVVDIYELGYLKATEQYREQLEKLGYQLNIVPGKKPADPIFPQSEKSG